MNALSRLFRAGVLALAVLVVSGLLPAAALSPTARIAILTSLVDSDAAAWRNAVTANGGTVSAARLASVSTLIKALKSSGAWANTDDYWLLVTDTATEALTSLKQRRLATAVNSPTFAANAGYTFDGALNYVDTGWIASSHAVAMTISNVRMAVYDRINVASNGYVAGVTNSGNRSIRIRPRVGSGAASLEFNMTGGSFNPTVFDSRGFTSGSRNGPDVNSYVGYKNGVAMVQASAPTGFATSISTSSVFIGGVNSTGSFVSGSPGTIGFLSVGAQLTAAQELAEYNAIQAYMTTWGANV